MNWDIHSKITHPVVDKMGFSYISFRQILTGNVSHDYYPAMVKKAGLHCDRNRGVSNFVALTDCRKSFLRFKKKALSFIYRNNQMSALFYLGKALHILQDLVSHSNFIDLNKNDRLIIVGYFLGGPKHKNFPNFKLTFWDPVTIPNEKADRYHHAKYAKDSSSFNKECRHIIKGTKQSKFDLAFSTAQDLTKGFLLGLKNKLKSKQWEKLKLRN
ncbi:MAG: hypothetical protein HOM21_12875 [Halobacteriovoraceae bacterium]|nr:hypothetical protein [Halobacteriovoraceae bacterium]